ncbi:MAG TPA: dynamin family protein [Chthoniobacterales bacterium]|nr:dynamin family protein [Chthoniobacterales bacterium]
MIPHILSPELTQQFDSLRILLQRALWLAEKCADASATEILRARLTNLQAAALLVIVGEVKAGKSSFINALLGEDVCEVAPGPCTVRIQELVYGTERSVASLGQSWERVSLPKEALREITFVDTPGTNSIIQHHQTITENYIPQSDLVVFVFSAANPHTNSAWELLTVIRKEWHRKMVFVLQQSDRASAKELTTNREHVKQYARERGVQNPTVFTLSAKRELEGVADSGYAEFRNFLRYGIECGEVWRTKVEGSYQTIRTVMGKILANLRSEKSALADERTFYQDLLQKVEVRQARANALKLSIVGQLSATYDRLARDSEDEFAEGLRIGEILRRAIPFAGGAGNRARLQRLRARFQDTARKEIAKEAPRVAQNPLGEMQALTEELNQTIARRQARMRENVSLPQTAGRTEMLEELRAKVGNLRVGEMTEILNDTVGEASNLRKLTLAGTGLALLGLAISVVSQNPLIDIAGGIFAAIGAFLVAAGLFWRRSGILRDFRQKVGDSRREFRDRLEAHITEIFESLFLEVRQALTESIFRLDTQASFLGPLLEETFQVGEAASESILRAQRMRLREPLPQTAPAERV